MSISQTFTSSLPKSLCMEGHVLCHKSCNKEVAVIISLLHAACDLLSLCFTRGLEVFREQLLVSVEVVGKASLKTRKQ